MGSTSTATYGHVNNSWFERLDGMSAKALRITRLRSIATRCLFGVAALVALKYPLSGLRIYICCLMVYLKPGRRQPGSRSHGSDAGGSGVARDAIRAAFPAVRPTDRSSTPRPRHRPDRWPGEAFSTPGIDCCHDAAASRLAVIRRHHQLTIRSNQDIRHWKLTAQTSGMSRHAPFYR